MDRDEIRYKELRCIKFCAQLMMLNNLLRAQLLNEFEYKREKEKLISRYRELLIYDP